jgi:hypothetical protein
MEASPGAVGCFYNPRPEPGRCLKDLQSNKVDPQCQLVQNTCQLRVKSPPYHGYSATHSEDNQIIGSCYGILWNEG